MEDVQCIFCNTGNSRIVIEENGYEGRKCSICGLIYVSPRPSFSEIQNIYIQDKSHGSAKSHISGLVRSRLYAKHNIRIIKRFINNGAMLEIGAGAGYFLDEARKEGFEVYGIELNDIQTDFIRSKLGIPCEESPLYASSFDGKRFDIIYHCDVISHFYNPIAEFKKMYDALVDNGILAFETGNLGDVKEKYYGFYTIFQYPDHLFLFSENNLRDLLRLTGFKFIKIYRYSILPQLLVIKILKTVIHFIKSQGRVREISKVKISKVKSYDIGRFNLKRLIRNVYHYVFYIIRYKIGLVMPKKGHPQTVIIIARKLTDIINEAGRTSPKEK